MTFSKVMDVDPRGSVRTLGWLDGGKDCNCVFPARDLAIFQELEGTVTSYSRTIVLSRD